MTDHTPPHDPTTTEPNASASERLSLSDIVGELERQIDATRSQLSAMQKTGMSGVAPTEIERRRREIEEQSGTLLAKYVVGYRLAHSTDFSAVMEALVEVLEGMLGMTRFEIYLRDAEQENLLLCTALPDAGARLGRPPSSTSVVAAAERGVRVVLSADELAEADPDTPRFWFPIRAGNLPVGGIAVFDLVPHKKSLEPEDLELLDLIGNHASDAIAAGDACSRKKYSLKSLAEVITHGGALARA